MKYSSLIVAYLNGDDCTISHQSSFFLSNRHFLTLFVCGTRFAVFSLKSAC
jgi:hypothetical protein